MSIQLPKDALARVDLGQAFAEYDPILQNPQVFVRTPAFAAADDPSRRKCFFVGRRGTGKTAIATRLTNKKSTAIPLHPKVLSPLLFPLPSDELDERQGRAFRSLVIAFIHALQTEVLGEWVHRELVRFKDLPRPLRAERPYIEGQDFDTRLLDYLDHICTPLQDENERTWLREIKKVEKAGQKMSEIGDGQPRLHFTLMIDRIDDSWDGSETAVTMLVALMHACIKLLPAIQCVRPLLFLRENVFDRARQVDSEFSRLETAVVSMEWTRSQLREMIERRLNVPFTTKLAVDGSTWPHFFESPPDRSSRDLVFDYCQPRPRDVLTYCAFAIDSARTKDHNIVTIDDLYAARRRFSESRLKDLGDEYCENYPQIALVLSRFYGLGVEFTVPGIEMFIQKLLADNELQQHCGEWIFQYTAPERFVQLFYSIGFFGLKEACEIRYRSPGPAASSPPPITPETHVVVHPTYRDTLDLQDVVIGHVDQNSSWQKAGLLNELPGSLDLSEYHSELNTLYEDLQTIPAGIDHASEWEDAIGKVLRLCFFRWLTNVQPQERNGKNTVRRDWIASNRAQSGFWAIIRERYNAVQVIWECKNTEKLQAKDFHQAQYYINDRAGRFVVVAFQGSETKHYWKHQERIAQQTDGFVLVLTNKDLQVFVRQAINGKVSENHIQTVYDNTVRSIS